jgi:hypothetical protein
MRKIDKAILNHLVLAKTDLQRLYITDMEGVAIPEQKPNQPTLNYEPGEPQDQGEMLAFFGAFLKFLGMGASSQEDCIKKLLESKAGRDWIRNLIRAMDGVTAAKNSRDPMAIKLALQALDYLFSTSDLSEANAVNKFPCLKQFLGDQQFRLKVVRALGDRLRPPQDKAFIEAVAQAISELGRSDADGLALLVDVYKRLVALNSQNAEYAGTYAVATMLFEAREKEFFDDLEALINAASAAAAIGALIIALGTGVGEIVIAIGAAVRAAQSLGELLQWLASRGYLPAF